MHVSGGDPAVRIKTSVPTEREVEENRNVVITCSTDSSVTNELTLTVRSRTGTILYKYVKITNVLTVILRLTHEFHEAMLQCETAAGVKSDTLSYRVQCKWFFFIL